MKKTQEQLKAEMTQYTLDRVLSLVITFIIGVPVLILTLLQLLFFFGAFIYLFNFNPKMPAGSLSGSVFTDTVYILFFLAFPTLIIYFVWRYFLRIARQLHKGKSEDFLYILTPNIFKGIK